MTFYSYSDIHPTKIRVYVKCLTSVMQQFGEEGDKGNTTSSNPQFPVPHRAAPLE